MTTNKPAYSIPLMSEIGQLPWNGYRVASTFSGAGGSCTGYRMAGFKVVWANEFVPIAQESYKANAAEDSILDGRDIHHIQPEEILAATGLAVGELDIFDGSPPCQAFSTAGKRHKNWGKAKEYEHGAKQCNELLFDEYVRLLRGLMPKVFLAENVAGLIRGTSKGMFLEILQKLKQSGYRVKCKLLDAQWLGVPQLRSRTIFIGVRTDLNMDPIYPKPFAYRYSVTDAIPWISDVRQSVFGGTDQRSAKGKPCPTIMASGGIGAAFGKQAWVEADTVDGGTDRRQFTIDEVKRICSFPDDFILKGKFAQQWERLGNSVPPLMMRAIATTIRDEILDRIKTK